MCQIRYIRTIIQGSFYKFIFDDVYTKSNSQIKLKAIETI